MKLHILDIPTTLSNIIPTNRFIEVQELIDYNPEKFNLPYHLQIYSMMTLDRNLVIKRI